MVNFCIECGSAVQPAANFCGQCGAGVVPGDSSGSAARKIQFEEKRARVLGRSQSGRSKNNLFYGIAGLVAIFGFLTFFSSLPSRGNTIIEQQPVVTGAVQYPPAATQMKATQIRTDNGSIILSLNTVLDKKIVAFDYSTSAGKIPLLAYVSPEGKVVTAVSMCEPCNSTHFHIRSDELVCNSCGTTWELDNLAGLSGACQEYPPDVVPHNIVADEIHISESIVANWTPRK